MPLDAIGEAAAKIRDEIEFSHSSLLEEACDVRSHVCERIRQWGFSTRSVLNTEFPFLSHEQNLSQTEHRLQSPSVLEKDFDEAVKNYTSFCKTIGRPANEAFWRKQFESGSSRTATSRKLPDEAIVGARLLLSEWRKRMDQARAEWELQKIDSLRAVFKDQIEELLWLLQKLRERLQSLGLDTGVLLDLSKGNLTEQDIQQLERWAKYFAEDEGIRALCDLLGKIRQVELSDTIERVRSVAPAKITLPDINSREEIVGVRLGRDLEHALPAELTLLSDPDTTVLFDLKYVESRLMCFDMRGIQSIHRHVETEEERKVKQTEKRGPMVICIDTSGSMNGAPETVAKAVALFLAAKAREQKRSCYLINFSTGIDTLDLGTHIGMEALLRFLQKSFHGGTDVAPALDHALHTMEQDAYRNADLLVVSDFIMSELPEPTLARIESRRLEGNRFHSLVVGSCYLTRQLKTLFDNEWVYDPRSSRIHELVGFERRMSEPISAHR